MGKIQVLTSILLLLGLVSCGVAYTTYPVAAPGATMTFDTVIGQSSLTSSVNNMLRTPADLVYNPRGGLYVSDVNGNSGGRVFYYSNPASNAPDFVLGAANYNQSQGQLGNPSGLGLYSSNNNDNYLAVGTRGNGFSKFYNLTAGNNQNNEGSDYVSSLGTQLIQATSTQFLALTVNQNNGELYVADTGNNRVAVLPANATSLPLFYYGAGSDGTSATCNASGATCFSSPGAVAIDCNQGVWISVTAVGGVNIGVGILYFPANSRVASALYLPNTTQDFTPGYIFGIAFNAVCTRISIAGSYRVYVGSVSLSSANPGANPVISNLVSLGLYNSAQNIPAASAISDSLTTVQNTAWDPLNPNRLAIADQNHNRVVIGTVPGASSSSSAASNSVGLTTPSSIASPSNFSIPSASNITVPSASPSASSAANISVTATPTSLNFTLPSASNLTVSSASASTAANFSMTPSPIFITNFTANSNNSASASESSAVALSSTNSFTSTMSSSSFPSFTTNPNSESSPSESESESSSPLPTFYTDNTGSASTIQSWVAFF